MKIELKKWDREDRKILKDMCNKIDRRYLSNRIPEPYRDSDAEWWLNFASENDGKNGIFRAIVVDGIICGNISIEKRGDIYTKEGVLGYFLLSDYWNKGVMTKSTEEICKLAFEILGITRIMATTFDKNIASRKVLEKNGFKLEGIREKAIYKNEIVYDECIYGKLKQEIRKEESMKEKWERLIKLIGNKSIEIHTYSKIKKQPLWFSVSTDGNKIYVDKAKENFPSSELNKQRPLGFRDFEKIYPLYLERENGEILGEERRKKSANSSYWFGIIKYILEE